MMAIPRAFMLLGLLPGGAIMMLIGCLTFFTLSALITTSAALGGSSSTCSYGGLVRATLGWRAERVLQLAVLVNCWVMNVVFVVVLGDILVGSAPDYGGLLPEWSGASPEACVWLRRDVVLGAVSMAVLLPLAAMRSMDRLAVVNIIGACAWQEDQRGCVESWQ
jgi:amino acid permease